MSACIFIASDIPLVEYEPPQNYPIHINLDNRIIEDGGADDNYFLTYCESVGDYTDKKYGVSLEWNYTDGRAKQIIKYIKDALQEVDAIEFWHVWLMDYYELEDRPFVHKKTVHISELTVEHIKEMDNADMWNVPDKMFPERPSFYCLVITK